jgi:hypothetical protein
MEKPTSEPREFPPININLDIYERHLKEGMLEKLIEYLNANLKRKLVSVPSAISLRVVHASKNRIYLKGDIVKDTESVRVEADIVWTRSTPLAWLSRQKSVAGQVRINPPSDYATKKKDYERYIKFYKYYFNLALKANGFFYAIIGGILSIILIKEVPPANAKITAYCIMIAVFMSFAFGGLFIYGSILWNRMKWRMNVVRSELNIEKNVDVHFLTIALGLFGAIFVVVGIVMLILAGKFFIVNAAAEVLRQTP